MVQGLEQLQRRWSAIPAKVKAAVEAAMERVAEDVVRDMRKLAPKGATGDLVRSISWTWGEAPKGSMTIGKTEQGRAYGAMVLTIYAGGGDAFYARFQEFGTVDMAANPFFFPVWRIWRRRVRGRIAAAIRRAIAAA